MRIFDVTLSIGSSTPTYLGDPSYKRRLVQSIAGNDLTDVSLLTMSAHIGTHVDAPSHLIDGANSIDHIPLSILVGRVLVVEFIGKGPITPNQLEMMSIPNSHQRVLFKTRNSALLGRKEFVEDYVGITEAAAFYLVQHGVKLVGIDYLSIDAPGNPKLPAHRALLAKDVVIVEGLDLSDIHPGEYTLVCLPLKIEGSEGAPARAILLPKQGILDN